MGGIGIEEAAAIGAQHLDGFLIGNGSHSDNLRRPFHGGGILVGLESLRDASNAEEKCKHHVTAAKAHRLCRG